MTLMDYCMQYIGEIMDGKRAAPEGVTLTETDPMRRSLELLQKAGDIPTLVRMCAAQDGTEIPQKGTVECGALLRRQQGQQAGLGLAGPGQAGKTDDRLFQERTSREKSSQPPYISAR